MSGDEAMLWMASAVIGLVCWIAWYVPSFAVKRAWRGGGGRWLLRGAPPLAAVLLWLVIVNWASANVVGAYRWLYVTFGAAWVGFGMVWLPWLGLSARDDVLERGNSAAGWALAGAVLGLTGCFAGANIGNGPGWWVVLFTGGLATGVWFGSWLILELFSRASESITVERDIASGLRLGALLIAAGLVLGRAAAGDWHSVGETVRDFVTLAWPAPLLVVGAIVVESLLRPSVDQPQRPWFVCGVVPATAYLGLAAAWLVSVGWWT